LKKDVTVYSAHGVKLSTLYASFLQTGVRRAIAGRSDDRHGTFSFKIISRALAETVQEFSVALLDHERSCRIFHANDANDFF